MKPGDNHFVLEADDREGYVVRKEQLVIYEIPKVEQLSSRLRIVLLHFERKGDTSYLSETVHDSLYSTLENQNRFGLVERLKLNQILQECKLSQTEEFSEAILMEPESAQRLQVLDKVITKKRDG